MVLSHWQLIPANRPGLAVARWQIDSGTDELVLEIFQEAPVEPGLLDAIVLSVAAGGRDTRPLLITATVRS